MEILPHKNSAYVEDSTNSISIEAVDIFSHYFFLHAAQVGVEHEEVE